MTCRCPSCGYLHDEIDAERPPLGPEPVALPAVVIPVVVQQSRCPLCGELFEDPEQYTAHRERNCAPAPDVVAGAAGGDPAVTEPNPAEPAVSEEP